ncbi:MAG: translation initiation factor [Flavobacteriaceae bacterium]|nr:translation initiation factor [Flavobacteriaceae bacterium]|tara:strand:- start:40405 stop:40761 length:357 start_codon:yes stop_codon:yes gene_type:complete
MKNKLNSLSDLSTIKFDNLSPDKEDIIDPIEEEFEKLHFELHFSKKGRSGKIVTLVKGIGIDMDKDKDTLEYISKKLKRKLSVGGSIKDGEIIIQGNNRDKIEEILLKMGHSVKKIGG